MDAKTSGPKFDEKSDTYIVSDYFSTNYLL